MIFGGLWNSSGLWNSKVPRRSRNLPGRPWRNPSRESRRLIRSLAAEVDAIAKNAGTGETVAALEQRVNVLVRAVNTSRAAGEVLPRDLEKLLAKLVRKLRRARVKRARRPSGFAQAAANVVVGVSFAFSLFVGLHILDNAGLFDEIVSLLAKQAQSLQTSWSLAEPGQMIAQANQALLATPSLPTPHATTRLGAVAEPSAVMPEITGVLPPADRTRSRPLGQGRSAVTLEDKLPATIGNPALRAAVLAGDSAAAYEVASRFAEGRGVAQSHEEEARWLERAATQGLAPAQFRLGSLYEKGAGVEKDLARARDLYLAAAQKGNGKAMHNLAVLYAEGINGTPDYEAAAVWFRKAADHGIKDSQYNLAILYGRGIGVMQNYAEAYKWFVLAANRGDSDAAIKRDEVAAYLDPQTREAARVAAQSWSPQPQPDDAINVKTQAAWETPAETPLPQKPKARPPSGDTRTADRRPN
jgi:TPR repeat protein